MLGLAAYEARVCECGWHESLTGDRSNFFTFEDRRCPVCAGRDRRARMLAEQDDRFRKALGENPPAAASYPSDGRRSFVRMMGPDEVAEWKARRGASGAEQPAQQ